MKRIWKVSFENFLFVGETCEFLQSTVCYIFNQVYNSRYVKSWVWGKQVFYAESRNAAWYFRSPLLREILFGKIVEILDFIIHSFTEHS